MNSKGSWERILDSSKGEMEHIVLNLRKNFFIGFTLLLSRLLSPSMLIDEMVLSLHAANQPHQMKKNFLEALRKFEFYYSEYARAKALPDSTSACIALVLVLIIWLWFIFS